MKGFIWRDQEPPEPRRINDDVVMRLDHVYEVDPAKMQRFPQQVMPVWDTKRIVDARWDHLDWMHDHFADEVLTLGLESETGAGELESEERGGPRPGPSGQSEFGIEDPPAGAVDG